MTFLKNHLHSILGAIGALCIMGGIGAADCANMNPDVPMPTGVWVMIAVGVVLVIAGVVTFMKGECENDDLQNCW